MGALLGEVRCLGEVSWRQGIYDTLDLCVDALGYVTWMLSLISFYFMKRGVIYNIIRAHVWSRFQSNLSSIDTMVGNTYIYLSLVKEPY